MLFVIALAASMLCGAGFVVFDDSSAAYAVLGGVIVALCWIAVGVFGPERARTR